MPRSVLAVAALLSLFLVSKASGQSSPCPPEPAHEVLYEITIRYYDADVFAPYGFNFVDYGPAYTTISAPDRIIGALNPRLQETKVTVEEVANGSLAFSMSNKAEVLAKKVDGHSFGNGCRILIDAYVKGATGTPYYATRMYDGIVETNFPQGFGRADAEFNGSFSSSVNGQGPTATPLHSATLVTGLSGAPRTYGGETYSHAGHYEFNLNAILFQSIDICFFSCPTMHYWARGAVTGSMEVGIGHPPCSGTIDQAWCGACFGGAHSVARQFAVSVDITPTAPSTSCACCEYRQYNRRSVQLNTLRFLGQVFDVWVSTPPNAAGERRNCLTWAEDSGDHPAGIMRGYGYRRPNPSGYVSGGVYVDNDRTVAQICGGVTPIAQENPDGCHFEGRDGPTLAKFFGSPRKYVEYEGRLVSKAACTPGASHDVVLARKRWTMCCENTGAGVITTCAESGPPQTPPAAFTTLKRVGPRDVQLMFVTVSGRVIAFAIAEVTPQLPLGLGAVQLDVPGLGAVEADDGPFEVGMWDGEATLAYFPFLLSAPVGGTVTATVDIFGDQATWQVDLSELGGPLGYCTAGTSTNGCTAVMSAIGAPSAAASSGFQLVSSGVEAQKAGLIFYGISGRVLLPWKPGSTSYLCVKLPTQRMTMASSGGAAGSCDGLFLTDWLGFLASNPGSLGQPFQAGAVCDAQSWYRDPAAPGATNLSNGVEWILTP